MINKIEISRELADELLIACSSMGWTVAEKLRALLAAPVVERPPVKYPTLASLLADLPDGYSKDDVAFGWNECMDNTSPPAPVSVVPDGWRLVPLHPTMEMLEALMEWNKVGNVNAYNNILNAAPACLDKVKELSQ